MAVFRPTKISDKGIDFLIDFEGEVLHAYNDPAGFCTYGVGHLIGRRRCTTADYEKYGSRAHPKPRAEARRRSRRLLRADLEKFEKAVLREVPWRWRRRQIRFDALVSLAFNLGEGILTPEPPLESVGKALRAPRVTDQSKAAVARAIRLFDKAGGQTLPGLTRRRRAEARLFTTGSYSTE